jgi:hypothetical protein
MCPSDVIPAQAGIACREVAVPLAEIPAFAAVRA